MDPKKFARRMEWHAKTFEANVGDLIDRVALTVHSTVALGTPVDEGRARGSWFMEHDRPADGMLGKDDKSEFGAAKAIDKARAKVASRPNKRSFLNGRALHITNNLPYIEPLNNGHSQQAPAGFVEDAVEAGIKQVTGAKVIGKGFRISGGGDGN